MIQTRKELNQLAPFELGLILKRIMTPGDGLTKLDRPHSTISYLSKVTGLSRHKLDYAIKLTNSKGGKFEKSSPKDSVSTRDLTPKE